MTAFPKICSKRDIQPLTLWDCTRMALAASVRANAENSVLQQVMCITQLGDYIKQVPDSETWYIESLKVQQLKQTQLFREIQCISDSKVLSGWRLCRWAFVICPYHDVAELKRFKLFLRVTTTDFYRCRLVTWRKFRRCFRLYKDDALQEVVDLYVQTTRISHLNWISVA